ncbi:MAG: secretin N-terminal domain-containing protein [Verrucomicrobiota bacterium]|jgi:type II secretory pathway component GspD/PulD (secretin)
MKSKKIAIALIFGLALYQFALGQTNTAVTNQPTPAAASAADTNEAAQTMSAMSNALAAVTNTVTTNATASNVTVNVSVIITNGTASAAGSNQPAEPMSAMSNSPSSVGSSNEAAGVIETNQPTNAMAVTSNQMSGTTETNMAGTNLTSEAVDTNETVAESIPLIQFQDVPIRTAIENLARQAGINYLLDPKIDYGQPDQNGQIKPEPELSIRWENVTAEQALLALLDNYGLQLVEDKRTSIARITIKDPTAPPPLFTKVIQLKYAAVSNMVTAVENTLSDKRSKVVPDSRTSQLVVVATEPEQDAVSTLVDELDKPTRQVLIETHLIEVTTDPTTSKGVDWTGTLAAQNISFGNGILNGNAFSSSSTAIPGATVTSTTTLPGGRTITTSSTPSSSTATTLNSEPQSSINPGGFMVNTLSGLTPDIGFLNADGLHAVLSFLNSSSDAQVISTPRIVTLDNEAANISVTRAFPVFNITAGTQGSPGGSQVAYTNVGTILDVTPRISANNYIWLKVVPQVSSFFGKDTETIAGAIYQADVFDYRSVTTQVLVPNANTLVMGGLVNDNPEAAYTKVPVLGDIPILGYAFRSENKSLAKDNLLIFITPSILNDSDFQPTETSFLKSEPVVEKGDFIHPNSLWDSSKPHDWSNPNNGTNSVRPDYYDKAVGPATNSTTSVDVSTRP